MGGWVGEAEMDSCLLPDTADEVQNLVTGIAPSLAALLNSQSQNPKYWSGATHRAGVTPENVDISSWENQLRSPTVMSPVLPDTDCCLNTVLPAPQLRWKSSANPVDVKVAGALLWAGNASIKRHPLPSSGRSLYDSLASQAGSGLDGGRSTCY